MAQRGQGTIEYLVILAIIVVIALIVVGLLLQTTSVGGGIGESQSKTAWKSAEPFSVIDFAQSADENLSLVVKNNSGSVLQLNNVVVDGVTLVEQDTGLSSVTNFAPNSTRVMTTADPSTECAVGNTFSYNASDVSFDYNTADISGRSQIGKSPLTGTCS